MDSTTTTVLAGLAGIIITGAFTYATQRAAAKAVTNSATTSSRTEVEKEAFDRAQKFYTSVMDRQDVEIANGINDVMDLRAVVKELREEIKGLRAELEEARQELDAAKAVLRLRYPED